MSRKRRKKRPTSLLQDLQHVYMHDESKDRTPGHKCCRMFLNADPKAFLMQLAGLEKADAPKAQEAEELFDEGEAIRWAEEWLKRHGEKVDREEPAPQR